MVVITFNGDAARRGMRIIRPNGEYHFYPNIWGRGYVLTREEYEEYAKNPWPTKRRLSARGWIVLGLVIVLMFAGLAYLMQELVERGDFRTLIGGLEGLAVASFSVVAWTTRHRRLARRFPGIFAKARRTKWPIPLGRLLLTLGLAFGGGVAVAAFCILGVAGAGLLDWFFLPFVFGFRHPVAPLPPDRWRALVDLLVVVNGGCLFLWSMAWVIVRFRIRHGRFPEDEDLDMPLAPGVSI